ncbi:MAG: P-II family nitrogen regulator [Pirellulales bacterium]|nr:P-II family nitrogen regulator [Pirellulales bacterium]MBL7192523.1 P-II family nitrogen regulator [Pirellulales bacterium]MDA0817305.1 P-II family nitrogen regulator [Planctomycetota bacterium]MDA0968939.1 P-II family nitrogen regulator [Planctomycetota bacterium]
MKEVIAIVKPFLAERVLAALGRSPLEACTVREVKGYGRQKNYLDQYGESDYSQAFLPKVEISMWVEDHRVDEVVDRVVAVARTGRMGDGKVFVMPAAEAKET